TIPGSSRTRTRHLSVAHPRAFLASITCRVRATTSGMRPMTEALTYAAPTGRRSLRRPSKSRAASVPRPKTAHSPTREVTRSQIWTAIMSPSTVSPAGPYSQSTCTWAPGQKNPCTRPRTRRVGRHTTATPTAQERRLTGRAAAGDDDAGRDGGRGDAEDQHQAAEEDNDLRGRMQTTAGPRRGRDFRVSVSVRGGGTGGGHSAAGADSTGVPACEEPVA